MQGNGNLFNSLVKKASGPTSGGSFGGGNAKNEYYNAGFGTGNRFDFKQQQADSNRNYDNDYQTKSTTSNSVFASSSFNQNKKQQLSQPRQASNSGRTSNSKSMKISPNQSKLSFGQKPIQGSSFNSGTRTNASLTNNLMRQAQQTSYYPQDSTLQRSHSSVIGMNKMQECINLDSDTPRISNYNTYKESNSVYHNMHHQSNIPSKTGIHGFTGQKQDYQYFCNNRQEAQPQSLSRSISGPQGYELKQQTYTSRAYNPLMQGTMLGRSTSLNYDQFGFQSYDLNQQRYQQRRELIKQKAAEAEHKLIADALLDKYRPENKKNTQFLSNYACQKLNQDGNLENALLSKSEMTHNNNDKMKNNTRTIDLDSNPSVTNKMEDYNEDEQLLFKDQIRDGTYGRPSKKKNLLEAGEVQDNIDENNILVLSDNDSEGAGGKYEVTILDQDLPKTQQIRDGKLVQPSNFEFMQTLNSNVNRNKADQYKNILETDSVSNDQSDYGQMNKADYFKQRNEKKLDYGTIQAQPYSLASIQQSFHSKYNLNQRATLDQKQHEFELKKRQGLDDMNRTHMNQMAKGNSFLQGQNQHSFQHRDPRQFYPQLNSSFNQSKRPEQQYNKIKNQNDKHKYIDEDELSEKSKMSSSQISNDPALQGLKPQAIKAISDLKKPFKQQTTEEIIRQRDKQNFNFAQKLIKKQFTKKEQKEAQRREDLLTKKKKLQQLLSLKNQKNRQNQQEKEFDEMFDESRLKDDNEKKDGNGFLADLANHEGDVDGLGALKLFDHAEGKDDDSPNQNMIDDKSNNLTPEEMELYRHQIDQHQMRYEMERQREFEEQLRMIRYKNRNNVDELIKPILNLEIVIKYSEEDNISEDSNGQERCQKNQFPVLPVKFESPQEYFDLWIQLFLYETYNQMINQRNESDKDRELSKLYGMKMKNDNSQKNFKGLIQRNKQDLNFIYLKLLEKDNDTGNAQTREDNTYGAFPHLSCLKEFDLLLISQEELDTTNVKQLTNSKFLMDISTKQGKFLAMVDKKRQGDKPYIEIKIDISHENYVQLNCSEFQYHKMNVYYFDSMSTRIREFRTIKSAEFYPASRYILDPASIPKRESTVDEEMEDVRFSEENPKANSEKEDEVMDDDEKQKQENMTPTPKEKVVPRHPVDRFQFEMHNFVKDHKDKFNSSQYQALIDVSMMNPVDFLLIQGPPGTGKTHTIKGIISMLNAVLRKDKKILVCAPSNAAIDEIITRLISKGGLLGQTEQESISKVLRIGAFDYEPSQIVKQVLFDTKINKGFTNVETKDEREKYFKQKQEWNGNISKCEKITRLINASKGDNHFKQDNIRAVAEELLADKQQIVNFMKYDKTKKVATVKKYKDQIQSMLSAAEHQRKTSGRNLTKQQRLALEKKIIDQTQIICTTLAMSTNEKLEVLNPGDIEYLIVDEACQSVELNNLIPFEHQPQRVILVGDQQQLPATTFSENAEKTNYSRSMFERFLENGVEKVMLEIQYRMDPLIREFPSQQFYDNRLKDADSIINRLEDKQYKESQVSVICNTFHPVQFIDLQYSTETASETSKTNSDEVAFIQQLIKKFINILVDHDKTNPRHKIISGKDIVNSFNCKKQGSIGNNNEVKSTLAIREYIMNEIKGSIGIISPYKSQVRCLKDKVFSLLRQYCNISDPQNYIEINTVDAFQGREKDIIVFSCVRSSKERSLGFVSDYRRMNVAITRAKHGLFVIGNSSTLSRDRNWNALIQMCKQNNSKSDKLCFTTYHSKDQLIVTSTGGWKHSSQSSSEKRNKSQEHHQPPHYSTTNDRNRSKSPHHKNQHYRDMREQKYDTLFANKRPPHHNNNSQNQKHQKGLTHDEEMDDTNEQNVQQKSNQGSQQAATSPKGKSPFGAPQKSNPNNSRDQKSNQYHTNKKVNNNNQNEQNSFLDQLRESLPAQTDKTTNDLKKGDEFACKKIERQDKNKDSGEEEGQILSSGQMADKQTTETENQHDKSQEINKNSRPDINLSSAESGEINKTDDSQEKKDKKNNEESSKLNNSSDKVLNACDRPRQNEEFSDNQSSTYQSYKSTNIYGHQPKQNHYDRSQNPFNRFNRNKKSTNERQGGRRDSFQESNRKDFPNKHAGENNMNKSNVYERKDRERSLSGNQRSKDQRRYSGDKLCDKSKDKFRSDDKISHHDSQSNYDSRKNHSNRQTPMNDQSDGHSGGKYNRNDRTNDGGQSDYRRRNNQQNYKNNNYNANKCDQDSHRKDESQNENQPLNNWGSKFDNLNTWDNNTEQVENNWSNYEMNNHLKHQMSTWDNNTEQVQRNYDTRKEDNKVRPFNNWNEQQDGKSPNNTNWDNWDNNKGKDNSWSGNYDHNHHPNRSDNRDKPFNNWNNNDYKQQRNSSQGKYNRNSSPNPNYDRRGNGNHFRGRDHQDRGRGASKQFVWNDRQNNKNNRDNDRRNRNSRDRDRSRSKSPFHNAPNSNWSRKRDAKDRNKQQNYNDNHNNQNQYYNRDQQNNRNDYDNRDRDNRMSGNDGTWDNCHNTNNWNDSHNNQSNQRKWNNYKNHPQDRHHGNNNQYLGKRPQNNMINQKNNWKH